MKTNLPLLALLFALPRIFQNSPEAHRHSQPFENVGSVSFPNSCAAEVQKPFNLGVALLHSYWYEEAEKQFAEVAVRDPKCPMAYWGEAMTFHRPAYTEPSEEDLEQGRLLMQKAEALVAKTDRERAYIAALAAFYAGEKVDYKQRAFAWCRGMEKVHEAYSDDHEAAGPCVLEATAGRTGPCGRLEGTAETVSGVRGCPWNSPWP